jgi:putative oxidoreductase
MSTAYAHSQPAVHAIPLAALAGRILISAIFILSGVMKFMDWDATAGYMASKGLPFIPVLLPLAAILEIVAGALVLSGAAGRWAALALFLFLVPTTLIFHNFWAYEGMDQQLQLQNFFKNLAIMGGLALIVAFGAGPVSVDEWHRTARLRRGARST